jgi:hypothetical protein
MMSLLDLEYRNLIAIQVRGREFIFRVDHYVPDGRVRISGPASEHDWGYDFVAALTAANNGISHVDFTRDVLKYAIDNLPNLAEADVDDIALDLEDVRTALNPPTAEDINLLPDEWILLLKDYQKALEHALQRKQIDGYVYVLKSVSGHYKIGRTKDPKDRLKTFSVKLPFEVEYELLIPSSNHKALEAELHQRFKEKHINGEWFSLAQDDIEALRLEYGSDV